jgi:hypothetical protein
MISRETVEEFTKALVNKIERRTVNPVPWDHKLEPQREVWRQAVADAFEAIGVKVEWYDEKPAPEEEIKF